MMISTALIVGGAIAGGGVGLSANKKRADAASVQAERAKRNYRRAEKMLDYTRLAGEASVRSASHNATEASREGAVTAFKNAEAAKAALAKGGVKGGTPFYAMGKYLATAQDAVVESDEIRALAIRAEENRVGYSIDEANEGLVDATGAKHDALSTEAYMRSPMAYLLAGTAGAFKGAMAGAKAATGLEGMGIDTSQAMNLEGGLMEMLSGSTLNMTPEEIEASAVHTPLISQGQLDATGDAVRRSVNSPTDYLLRPPSAVPEFRLDFGGLQNGNADATKRAYFASRAMMGGQYGLFGDRKQGPQFDNLFGNW